MGITVYEEYYEYSDGTGSIAFLCFCFFELVQSQLVVKCG